LKLKILFASVCVAVLMIGGCEVIDQEALLFFPDKLAADYKFDFKNLREEFFVDVDGAKLDVLRFYPGQVRGSVVYFHGNAGSLKDWGQVGSELSELGLEVFVIDYRGYGKSTGEISSQDQFLADAEAVFIACQKKTRLPIIAYGQSLGTGVAAYIGSKFPVKAVFLQSPYSSMTAMAEFHFPFLPSSILKYPLTTLEWLKQYSGQVYGFHGDKDQVVPYVESTKIQDGIGKRYHLTTVPGANHNDLDNFPVFETSRKAAFDSAL
jgi:fermentation-respiration switch protein FrsA (DUF1100 family)